MRLTLALYRAALLAYPRDFRREYGEDLVRTVLDRHRFGGEAPWKVLARELADVVPAAIRMREESPVTRLALAVAALAACVVAALAAGPLALVAVLVAAVAVLVATTRPAPSVDRALRRRNAWPWIVASAVSLAAAVAIPVVDGGELSGPRWSAMALLGVVGVALALAGAASLADATRVHRTTSTP